MYSKPTSNSMLQLKGVFNLRWIRKSMTLLMTLFLVFSVTETRSISTFFESVYAQENEVELIGITLDGDTIKQPGDLISYTFELSESIGEVTNVTVGYYRTYDGISWSLGRGFSVSTNDRMITAQGFNIEMYNSNGEYSISYVIFSVGEVNYQFNYNPDAVNSNEFMMQTGNFEVVNSIDDHTPPTLESISVDTSFAQVEGRVEYVVKANDDLSGVSFINLFVQLPNGSNHVIHTYMQAINDEDVFVGNIGLPFYDANGEYKVYEVVIFDQAGNVAKYVGDVTEDESDIEIDLSPYSFTISHSLPSPQVPMVQSIAQSNPVLDGGGSTVLRIELDPAEQDYQSVIAYYHVGNDVFVEFTIPHVSNGVFEKELEFSGNVASYSYELAYINVFFTETFRRINHVSYEGGDSQQDLSAGNFSVINTSFDDEAPVLVSVSSSLQEVGLNETTVITFTLQDASEITYFNYSILYPDGNVWNHGSTNMGNGVYQVAITAHNQMTSGFYGVAYVEVTDIHGNNASYTSDLDRWPNAVLFDLSDSQFTIYGTSGPARVPTISNLTISSSVVQGGEDVTLYVVVNEKNQDYNYANARFIDSNGDSKYLYLEYNSNGTFSGTLNISQYGLSGIYTLSHIEFVLDWAFYSVFNELVHPSEENKYDMQSADFTVENTLFDNQRPQLVSVSSNTTQITYFEAFELMIHTFDSESGVNQVSVWIEHPDGMFNHYPTN